MGKWLRAGLGQRFLLRLQGKQGSGETMVPETEELRLPAGPPPLRTALPPPAPSAERRSSELQPGHSGRFLSAPATASTWPSWHLPGPPPAPGRLPGPLWAASESVIIAE